MRILIAEEALQAGRGHWPSYIGSIVKGMREAGDHVDVLVHRHATNAVLESVGGTPWFSRNCWTDAASQGRIGGILHNFNFRRELAMWLELKQPYDWICALTMRLQHLLAFALLVRCGKISKESRFLLLFVQGFGRYINSDQSIEFPRNASTMLAKFCFKLLSPAVRSGRVILASETEGMKMELERFIGLPVVILPHPIPPQNCSNHLETKNNSFEFPNRVTIVCPGFARHEKGSDLLQDAIMSILLSSVEDHFRFVLQWPEAFKMPNGLDIQPNHYLVSESRVDFLNYNLDHDAYELLLSSADMIILPYRKSSYHNRVSRVAIEATSRGIPLIYTRGTWSGELAALVEAGVEIETETSDAVVSAMLEAKKHISKHKFLAMKNAHKVIAVHSAENFRQILTRVK